MKRIYGMDTVPTTIEKWYQATLRFQHVWEKTQEIAKGKINPFYQNHHRKEEHKKKDPDAMDVDAVRLSNEEQQKRFKEGRCYRCGAQGHIARGCKNPFAQKEEKKTENKKPKTTAKIEEVSDSDEEPTVGAVTTQDF